MMVKSSVTNIARENALLEELADSVAELRAVRYRFQGRECSAATGLANFRMRWYDAETGRWLSKDPIGLSGGLNLYAFCKGDSIDYRDDYGTARVGNRLLHGWGLLLTPIAFIPGAVIPLKLTNTFPEHSHIFFDDGSNIGWGPEGFFCEGSDDGYKYKGTDYNDDLMKKAVDRVKGDWQNTNYNGLTHNCQDFVDAVLKEYEKLQR